MTITKCKHREKPGADELCMMMAADGQELCPRHAAIHAELERRNEEKYRAKVMAGKVKHSQPKNRRELLEQGYQFTGNGNCRSCDAPIEWWRTPNRRPAPFNPMPGIDSPSNSHFATCKFANNFRRSA